MAPPEEAPIAPISRESAAPALTPSEAAAEEPKGDGGTVNVPPPITVTERPTNPKRGWWHRLTQG
jgi:hypothetical protein